MANKIKKKQKPDVGLGAWTLWSERCPCNPGLYWLAFFWPAEDGSPASIHGNGPFIWDVDDKMISGRYDINNLGTDAEHLIWNGPLIPPPLGIIAESKASQNHRSRNSG